MRMYKVISHYRDPKTRLPAPIYIPWELKLLTQAQRAEWEEYKKTPEYLGFDEAEKVKRSRIPEGFKLQEWVNSRQMGVARSTYRPTGDNRQREQIIMYQFELKPDVEYFFEAAQIDGEGEDENAKRSTQSVFRQLERREIYDEKTSTKSVEGFVEIEAIDEEVKLNKVPGDIGAERVEKVDYSKMTFNELQSTVKARGLKGKFGAKREELVEMLEHDDAAKVSL